MTLAQDVSALKARVTSNFNTLRTFLTGSTTGTFALSTKSQNVKGAIDELKKSDALRVTKTSNLADISDKAKALSNLGGASMTDISALNDDLVDAYNKAKS